MKVWDMHCDTLAELRYAQQAGKPKSFLHNDLMMDLERMKQGDYLLQCMACFVNRNGKKAPCWPAWKKSTFSTACWNSIPMT